MKTFVTAAGFAIGASAAILRRDDQCCFQLTATGGKSGSVGQLGDGQNRIGGGYGAATYCINNGMITDGSGRGCILTPPTTQFQCDKGASPDSGFSVNSNGMLESGGDTMFYACGATDKQYNIYSEKVEGQKDCVEIMLSTGGKCAANGESGSASMAASTPATYAQTSPAKNTGKTVATSVYSTTEKYTAPASTDTEYKTNTEKYTAPASTVTEYKTEKYTAPANTVTKYETAPANTVTKYETAPANTVTKYETATEECSMASAKTVTQYETSTEKYTAPAMTVTQYETKPAVTQYETKAVTQYETVSASCEYSSAMSEGYPNTWTQAYSAPKEETSAKSYASNTSPMQEYPKVTSTAEYTAPKEYNTAMTSAATSNKESPKASSTASASVCATSLVPGAYETPHLIVPMSSEKPDQSYGSGYNASCNGNMNSVFQFDIPQSYEGKTCTAVFMFPAKSDLETTDYTWNGKGSMDFSKLSGAISDSTTYNSCPAPAEEMMSVTPEMGNTYVISSGPCAAGMTETIEMSAAGGMEMEFFEDWNPSPLGMFITVC